MNEIIEIRMWWAMGIVIIGGLVPFFCFCIYHQGSRTVNAYALICLFVYYFLFFMYGRDVIPEKYNVVTEKVFQCEYVDKLVPKYPDGIVK